MKKSVSVIVAMLVFTVMVAGCNMFKGAGKDMENAGKGIQKTVDKND